MHEVHEVFGGFIKNQGWKFMGKGREFVGTGRNFPVMGFEPL